MAQRNKTKFNTPILIAALIIFTTAAIFLFSNETKTSKIEAKNDQAPQAEQIDQPKVNLETKIEATTAEINARPDLANLKMPILMYHYIRTVTDQNDKLGIGLSVVPSKFSQQLDEIQNNGYQTINFNDIEQNQIPAKPIILTFDDGYEDFYTTVYPELKKRNMTAVVYIIANKDGGQYMTKAQIKDISNNGIEIGSHTLSHIDLSKATTQRATTEITQSKDLLEKIIGKTIISFCYPSGKYNDEILTLVKSTGYKYATTTKPGLTTFSAPQELTRNRMNADTNINVYIK